jgi:Protein of unknown function (DUF3305)
VELFKDDAEGYCLNISTGAPRWFVPWRMHEGEAAECGSAARPEAVSLNCHDAGRWLDAQETVEQVAAPTGIVDSLKAFADTHCVQEPKRRNRLVLLFSTFSSP